MNLKLMTFNLRVDSPEDKTNDWNNRSEKAAKMIEKHHPLVVGTQEGLISMVKNLENSLSDFEWIGEGRGGDMKDEFCAIFYNSQLLKCVESGQFWLSEQPDVRNSISWKSGCPRICTWGHFRFKNEPDKGFIVFNSHLDHVSQLARENGIALICKTIKQHAKEKNVPIILTGDLNSEPDNIVIQFLQGIKSINGEFAHLQDAYQVMDGVVGSTFHNFAGGNDGAPIDYIFCTTEVNILKTEVDRNKVYGDYPSDHYPVISTLKI